MIKPVPTHLQVRRPARDAVERTWQGFKEQYKL